MNKDLLNILNDINELDALIPLNSSKPKQEKAKETKPLKKTKVKKAKKAKTKKGKVVKAPVNKSKKPKASKKTLGDISYPTNIKTYEVPGIPSIDLPKLAGSGQPLIDARQEFLLSINQELDDIITDYLPNIQNNIDSLIIENFGEISDKAFGIIQNEIDFYNSKGEDGVSTVYNTLAENMEDFKDVLYRIYNYESGISRNARYDYILDGYNKALLDLEMLLTGEKITDLNEYNQILKFLSYDNE